MARRLELRIQAPIGPQVEALDAEQRFKLLRWGRRASKTRCQFIAATMGHKAQPNGKGVLQGGDVIWVARDYPNAKVIWREEIKPRFGALPREICRINEQEHRIELKSHGSLEIWSADNIASARGGAVDGIIMDECAHWDLYYAWFNVLRPMLIDRKGWAIFGSTTWMGSYFNELCQQFLDGTLGERWYHSHATAWDNPTLDPDEIQEIIDSYPEGSAELDQEMFAKLTVPGGLAFREWNQKIHVTRPDWEPTDGWAWAGSVDWGYHQGHAGVACNGPEGEFVGRWEFYFKELTAYEAGYSYGLGIAQRGFGPLEFVAADAQMWATTEGPVTIAEKFQAGMNAALGPMAPTMIKAPKGPNSRHQRKMVMHEYLRWTPNPKDPTMPPLPWDMPKARWHPDCEDTIRTLPRLPLDEKNPEVVDTTKEDHPFDSWTYLMMTRPPQGERVLQRGADIHPGARGRRSLIDRLKPPDPTPAGRWVRHERGSDVDLWP